MEKRDIDKMAGQIRLGKKVMPAVAYLNEQVSVLRLAAHKGTKDKSLESGTISWLHKEANYIENELYHALTYFIEQSNPRKEVEMSL
jgi:hypothetical protein